jgi:hypothetical protein
MRIRWFVYSFVTLLLFNTESAAQKSPDAVALLSSCAVATGTTLETELVIHARTKQAHALAEGRTLAMMIKGSTRQRIDYGNEGALIVNGTRGFQVMDGARKAIPLHAIAYFRSELVPGLVCLTELNRPKVSISSRGLESVAGVSALHVGVLAEDKDPDEQAMSYLELYLDPVSNLPLRMRTFVFSPEAIGNKSVLDVSYADYRRAGSVIMPYSIKRYLDGSLVEEISVESVQSDAIVADSYFE